MKIMFQILLFSKNVSASCHSLYKFWYCFINDGCTHLSLGTHIKGLYKLTIESVIDKREITCKLWKLIEGKTHVFISGLLMFLSHIYCTPKQFFRVCEELWNVTMLQ